MTDEHRPTGFQHRTPTVGRILAYVPWQLSDSCYQLAQESFERGRAARAKGDPFSWVDDEIGHRGMRLSECSMYLAMAIEALSEVYSFRRLT